MEPSGLLNALPPCCHLTDNILTILLLGLLPFFKGLTRSIYVHVFPLMILIASVDSQCILCYMFEIELFSYFEGEEGKIHLPHLKHA